MNDEKMNKELVIKIIEEVPNPYPPDLFDHNNEEVMKIRRGRLNKFIFDVVENIKADIIRTINELEEEKKEMIRL